MNIIKRKIKNKIWHDNRCKKKLKFITKYNKNRRRTSERYMLEREIECDNQIIHDVHSITIKCQAPQNFSIMDNTEETIGFFNYILYQMNRTNKKVIFFLDLSDIQKIDTDALMYLIALMNDLHSNILKKYSFKGTFPEDKSVHRILTESGFLDYVKSNRTHIIPRSNKIQIRHGTKNTPDIAREACEMVQKICNIDRIKTISLYNILVELMDNTKNHAYTKKTMQSSSANSWYLFAEETDDSIRFVFLDTGLGIPCTVYKNWHERLPLVKKDSEFICSALRGDFRTETQKDNRSKGLPQISLECIRGIIHHGTVISGKGFCRILHTKTKDVAQYKKKDLKNKISGTLFSWYISKKKEKVI